MEKMKRKSRDSGWRDSTARMRRDIFRVRVERGWKSFPPENVNVLV